ncbi:MAG: hypothetical protein AWU57_567 [Marinobacter sp. T13-3]|nr:MAG: hypothetical protein AWU57_567 [Marinobacter sp. T13-3]
MTNQVITQEQYFHKAHRETSDTLQQAYWMAGQMKDQLGRVNPNPMTHDEIQTAANSDKPYAWAFQMILEGRQRAAASAQTAQ